MTNKAKAVNTLYKLKRITLGGVEKAVKDNIITTTEYKEITGKEYE